MILWDAEKFKNRAPIRGGGAGVRSGNQPLGSAAGARCRAITTA